MAQRFRDRAASAVEVGAMQSPALGVVDPWIVGQWPTTDDNVAFVRFPPWTMWSAAAQIPGRDGASCPFPERSLEEAFRQLEADETAFREQFSLTGCGEILGNAIRYIYLDNGDL